MGLLKFELAGNQGIKMVDPAGFEPATKGLWDLRSNHWAKDPRQNTEDRLKLNLMPCVQDEKRWTVCFCAK